MGAGNVRGFERFLPVLALALLGCRGGMSVADAADVFGPSDAREAAATDAFDVPPDEGGVICDPGAHIDCFGGAFCRGGTVYVNAYAPYPCCTNAECMSLYDTDPLICVPGESGRVCQAGACPTTPSRYDGCLQWWTARGGSETRPPDSLLRAECGDPAPTEGIACVGDDDCRPGAPSAVPLRCDLSSHTCTSTTRPPAPAGDGGTCTIACNEDEDCPDGTYCACQGVDSLMPGPGFCVLDGVADAGLSAEPRCPAPDAGDAAD